MIDGILVINKEKNYTSRDVVNIISKKFHTKKVGHTGTLDPLATGALVLCLGNHLKISELLTAEQKEYIATLILGIETDTLDITGNILQEDTNKNYSQEQIETVLKSFLGTYSQEVPKYSAVKVNGRKLYEYARKNIDIDLPKREVTIYNIELLNSPHLVNNHLEFTIKCQVSKGTYIRSLIRDIGKKLGTVATMKELQRTKQGTITLDKSYTLEDIDKDNYKLLNMKDVLALPTISISKELEPKIKNGCILPKFFTEDKVIIQNKDNTLLGIYQTHPQDPTKCKPWKIFSNF